jgi:predicted TIM-barrel fold metal-dependent hydrolase
VAPTFEQLRPLCPPKYLEAFDAFADREKKEVLQRGLTPGFGFEDAEKLRQNKLRNVLAQGAWDVKARLADMDYDGVAAEIIYHGLPAGPGATRIPFDSLLGLSLVKEFPPEMVAVGRHMYNEWLAEFCSAAPERLGGLAQLPMDDPKAALKELEWCAKAGLRGVNFPRVQPAILAYNKPEWEDLWFACEEYNMTLNTHSSGIPIDESDLSEFGGGPGFLAIVVLDSTGYPARRAMHYLIFGGVFERHPNLRLVLSEQPGNWWPETVKDMDSLYIALATLKGQHWTAPNYTTGNLTKLPSEYAKDHVFISVAGVARHEAESAIREGYDSQILWGRDYPHPEGAYQYPRYEGEPSWNRLHLQDAFAGLPIETTAAMLGESGAPVFGFDLEKLRIVAERIEAPTFEQINTPVEIDLEEPSPESTQYGFYLFRRHGPYH